MGDKIIYVDLTTSIELPQVLYYHLLYRIYMWVWFYGLSGLSHVIYMYSPKIYFMMY